MNLWLGPVAFAITDLLKDGEPHTFEEIKDHAGPYSDTNLSPTYIRMLLHPIRKKLREIDPTLNIRSVTRPEHDGFSYQIIREVPQPLDELGINLVPRDRN